MARQFDVFLSFKNLDARDRQTRDARISSELYAFLTKKGLSVFQSNIVLEALGEAAYKKAIDDALDSAKVLVAVGTSTENLESKWVRYEWDSFFTDILSGIKPDGKVFTYIEGLKINSLPRSLRQTQTLVHGTGSIQKLYNFISNALRSGEPGEAAGGDRPPNALGLTPGRKFIDRPPLTWEDFSKGLITGTKDPPGGSIEKTDAAWQGLQKPPFLWTEIMKEGIGDRQNDPAYYRQHIEEIKNDPTLTQKDKDFLIHMDESARLNAEVTSTLQALMDLDNEPGGGSAQQRESLTARLEALNKEQEEHRQWIKKMQWDQHKAISHLFKK